LKQRTQQLTETREKLNEAKKKAQDQKATRGPAGSQAARVSELEEDLKHARELTEQAHGAEQAARKDAQAAKAEAARREGDTSRLQEKVRELSSQLAALPKPGTAVVTIEPQAVKEDARIKELEATVSELRAKENDLDGQLKIARKQVGEARDELKKFRGRAETNNRVYLVTKGELELTKERLAAAEKRLWESGIPLVRPEPKPRPKGKGPASVDRALGAEKLEGEPAPVEAAAAEHAEPAEAKVEAAAEHQVGEPKEEAPKAAVVAPPSDEVLQRIGAPPKRRRPNENGTSPGEGHK
jgi:DNA repair exonuclease SbcCD ATPase subunit